MFGVEKDIGIPIVSIVVTLKYRASRKDIPSKMLLISPPRARKQSNVIMTITRERWVRVRPLPGKRSFR